MQRKFDFMTAKSGNTTKWKHERLSLRKVLKRFAEVTDVDTTTDEYHNMTTSQKANIKLKNPAFFGGFFEGKRSSHTIQTRSLVALDIDTKFDGDLATHILNATHYSFYIYESLSSLPEHKKYRVIFFLDEDIAAAHYEPVARALADEIGLLDYVDHTCYRKAQLMYLPAYLSDHEEPLNMYMHNDGEDLVDVAEILDSFNDITDQREWARASDEGAIASSIEMQLGDPRDKAGIVGQFCTFVGDIHNAIAMFNLPYERESEMRYSYTGGESANGFVVYDDEQHCYSNHETDPAAQGGHSLNAWDLVRVHLFGEQDTKDNYVDATRAPSYKALVEYISDHKEFKAVRQQAIADKALAATLDDIRDEDVFDEVLEEDVTKKSKRSKRGKKSKRRTFTVKGKVLEYDVRESQADAMGQFLLNSPDLDIIKEKGVPRSTARNLATILLKSPYFKNRIVFDEFARSVVYLGRKVWGGQPEWSDADTTELRLWCEGWGMQFSKGEVDDVVLAAAKRCTINTLHDFFANELPEWDKVDRISTLFHDCLGAEDNEDNALIARKTLLGGLERALVTDRSKVQTVTVLQGAQGIKKSTFWEKLCPVPAWFADSKINIGHKDGYSVLAGSFIIELGELASLKRADRDEIKNFISADSDKYRPSYARYDSVFNRHNIFVGSVNDTEFLSDPTGNRRFKVVACAGGVDVYDVMTKDYVLQLWAQAKSLRDSGAVHWYDEAEEARTEAIAADFTKRDVLEPLIKIAVLSNKPKAWADAMPETRLEILQNIDAGRYTKKQLVEEPLEQFTTGDIIAMLNISITDAGRYTTRVGQIIAALPNVKRCEIKNKATKTRKRGFKIVKEK